MDYDNQTRVFSGTFRTLSLPVLVIMSPKQEAQALATVTWDNAFSNIVREPFQTSGRVIWSQMALALNTKFESITDEKLFPLKNAGGEHKDYVTWIQFCKEKLPERSFTFWEWFFAIMKLTKEHCQSIWKAGSIVGFISKPKADEILRQSPVDGITLAVTSKQYSVLMLKPWTPRDRGLADRIHDIPFLLRVYPTNRARNDACGEFYRERQIQVRGNFIL
uniref:Signal transducer and activator of transcription linker domain-containing protein n=1 Tax=Glossina pallidipes TaxID=7398 RepID=A0A1B0A8R5_GLOPL